MSEPPAPLNGTLHYRMGEAEKDIQNLSNKVDRLTWVSLS